MLSKSGKAEKDKRILLVVKTFLEYNCRISDSSLSKLLNISSSTINRDLTSDRTKELIGIDNFAYIKKERLTNKKLGRIKGGSKKKNG